MAALNHPHQPPELIKLLAHDLRWNMLKALAIGDYRVQELVKLVDQPMNLVSYHLKKLRDDGIVNIRRGDADGRDVYYSLDVGNLHNLYQKAGIALHPALGLAAPPEALIEIDEPLRILFVCTHNSARSQMAEALTRHLAHDHVEVYSAGSDPAGIHPDAVRVMDGMGIDIREQKSKHLREFEGQPFDYIITVCDLAHEICPIFPGNVSYIHWSFPDPAKVQDADERLQTFELTAQQLQSRITFFLAGLSAAHL